MTSTIIAPPKLKTIRQDFSVRFTYDVHFTEGLFHRNNSLLSDVLTQANTSSTQVLPVVDSGV